MSKASKLVVMASGAGSTLSAIAEAIQIGKLQAQLAGVVVSRQGVGAIDQARKFGVPCVVLSPKDFSSHEDWDQALSLQVAKWQPDLIALAGFTLLLGSQFLQRFKGQIVNTHPSLLPKYGGKGMYGMKVHQAVVAAKEKQSGITVHQVTAEYDEGPIVAQRQVQIEKNESAESLAERIKSIEKEFYISVLGQLLEENNLNK